MMCGDARYCASGLPKQFSDISLFKGESKER